MRIFGLVGLVLVLLIGGFMLGKQTSVQEAFSTSGTDSTPSGLDAVPRARHVQQDTQRALDAAMRTLRDVPSEP